jgi:hypothetical protein
MRLATGTDGPSTVDAATGQEPLSLREHSEITQDGKGLVTDDITLISNSAPPGVS